MLKVKEKEQRTKTEMSNTLHSSNMKKVLEKFTLEFTLRL